MNKVVNINLSGFVFTIDEDAYQILKQYLDRLTSHFSGKDGSAEIISDIETRIAELLQQGLSHSSQVVQLSDVRKVISLMGEPWQISGEEGEEKSRQQPYQEPQIEQSGPKHLRRDPSNKVIGGVCGGIGNYLDMDPIVFRMIFAISFFIFGSGLILYLILWIAIQKAKPGELNNRLKSRRIFRDPDNKTLGGVCSGLGYFFGIDPVWFRIGFLVALFVYGGGVLLYLILWITLPFAKTAADKLQMKGEPVDISNIERVVSSSFPKAGEQISKAGNLITDIIRNIFHLVGKLIGFILVSAGIFWLIVLLMILFNQKEITSLTSIAHIALDDSIISFTRIGVILIIGSFAGIILLSGIKLLFGYRFKSRIAYLLLGVAFFMGCLIQAYAVSRTIIRFKDKAVLSEKSEMGICPDTLYLNSIQEDSSSDGKNWTFHLNGGGCSVRYLESDQILYISSNELNIRSSEDNNIKMEIVRSSRGSSKSEATKLARNIDFSVVPNDSGFSFYHLMKFDNEHPYVGQFVRYNLRIPEGTIVITDPSIAEMIKNRGSYDSDIECSEFRVIHNGLECINKESADNVEESEDESGEIQMKLDGGEEGDMDSVVISINKDKKQIRINESTSGTKGKKVRTVVEKVGPITIRNSEVINK